MEFVIFIGFASFVCGATFSAGYIFADHVVRKLMSRW